MMDDRMNNHADQVRRERLARGWSVRVAAMHGQISNTYWGEFEDYKRALTPMIAEAVAKAYEWPEDWADKASEEDVSRLDAVEAEVAALRKVVEQIANARLGDDPAAGTSRGARSKPPSRPPASTARRRSR